MYVAGIGYLDEIAATILRSARLDLRKITFGVWN